MKPGKFWDVTLGILLAYFVAAPLHALITTGLARTYWDWFLRPQFGPGPTMLTWYGLSCLVSVFVFGLKTDDVDVEGVVQKAVAWLVWHALLGAIGLSSAWVVRAMLW